MVITCNCDKETIKFWNFSSLPDSRLKNISLSHLVQLNQGMADLALKAIDLIPKIDRSSMLGA